MPTVNWLLLKDFCQKKIANNFFLVIHFLHFFNILISNTKNNVLKTTSPGVLVPWVQSTVQWLESSLLQDSGYLSNLRVKHLSSSSPSVPPWPWPLCWPGGYWDRGRKVKPTKPIFPSLWTGKLKTTAAMHTSARDNNCSDNFLDNLCHMFHSVFNQLLN